MPIPDSDISQVLVIAAHPDDIDFGVAGTIANWTDAGIAVHYCLVTNGDAGGFDSGKSREELAAIRQREQTEAANVVGVKDLTFLGYPDGIVEATLDLRRDLSRVIRQVKPQRVLAPSPDRYYDRIYASHPDHLAVGVAAISAVYPDSRNAYAFPELVEEGFEPHTVLEHWMMATPNANYFVDVTGQFERKMKALFCHDSQHPKVEEVEPMMRGWQSKVAETAGFEEGRLAEAFQIVDAV